MMPVFDMPSDDEVGKIKDFLAFRQETMLAERTMILRFKAMLCCCRPMGTWPADSAARQRQPHISEGCQIHSGFTITPEGDVLI